MTSPAQLKYASSHEWVQDLGDGVFAVGISNHAQEALGDIVFLEFPKVGRVVKAEEAVAVVESVKAASDIYAPVSGKIIGKNDGILDTPENINSAPYDNWLFKIQPSDAAEIDALLTAEAYATDIGE